MMKYKNYIGVVQFDDDAGVFFGEVINTKDVITFEGKTVNQVRKSFKDSIEDYLEFCESRGENPDKPFSGKLNLRLDPELHKKTSIEARKQGKSLNAFLVETIERAVGE